MNRSLLFALLAGGALPLAAQEPVAGVRFHLQLVWADTTAQAARDPQLLPVRKVSGALVQCILPDSGKARREKPECGPNVRTGAWKVLADTTITLDSHGHATQRLAWRDGDAVVELDAAAADTPGPEARMRLKVGFWPRLARGEVAQPQGALRLTNAAATIGHTILVTVMHKDGAQMLVVLPERVAAQREDD